MTIIPLTNLFASRVSLSSPLLNLSKKRLQAKEMIPQQWTPPCGSQCTQKYSALTQIPWRVFCKKGCDSDGDTWEECLENCDQICYKDPVLKDRQWSAYIDRSPGSACYSEDCFHACIAGCGFKLDIHPEKVGQTHPNRPTKPPLIAKPPLRDVKPTGPDSHTADIPSTLA